MNIITDDTFELLSLLLKSHIVDIKFKKVDGSIRDMYCTMVSELLPPQDFDDTGAVKPPRKINDTTQLVYDLEAKEFKSFRKVGLISYTINIKQESV